jgi:hypothetical protein
VLCRYVSDPGIVGFAVDRSLVAYIVQKRAFIGDLLAIELEIKGPFFERFQIFKADLQMMIYITASLV